MIFSSKIIATNLNQGRTHIDDKYNSIFHGYVYLPNQQDVAAVKFWASNIAAKAEPALDEAAASLKEAGSAMADRAEYLASAIPDGAEHATDIAGDLFGSGPSGAPLGDQPPHNAAANMQKMGNPDEVRIPVGIGIDIDGDGTADVAFNATDCCNRTGEIVLNAATATRQLLVPVGNTALNLGKIMGKCCSELVPTVGTTLGNAICCCFDIFEECKL